VRSKRRGLVGALMRARSGTLATTLAVLSLAGPAFAQVGASIGVRSDHIYRGRSLTEHRPAATLSLGYDNPKGYYAGAALTAYDTARGGVEVADGILYAGYAKPLGRGGSLDLGVSQTRTISYRSGRRAFDYAELYAGVITEHASLRVHYAPDYYETGMSTLYIDAGATFRPTEAVRVFARAGALTPVAGGEGLVRRRTRYDVSVGVARRIGDLDLGLSWTRLTPAPPIAGRRDRGAVVVGATFFF
jgi:uncharacterized protein (TIGR02001 family)